MDFLTRGDAVTIFGRRIPVSALAVAATILAAYMVMRARSRGGNVAAVGATPATSNALSTVAPPSISSTYDPNAAAISQLDQSQNDLLGQLQQIQNQLAANATPPAPAPAPATAPANTIPTGLAYGGSGFGYFGDPTKTAGITESIGGQSYEEVPWSPTMNANNWAGVYYQPAPGVFAPAAGAVLQPGTPLFMLGPGGTTSTTGGKGGIKGAAGTVSAYGWSSRGPVHGRVRSSAYRHPSNPLAAAA